MSDKNTKSLSLKKLPKAISALVAERQRIMTEANDAFKDAYAKIREQIATEGTCIFTSRYKIGKLISEMKEKEDKYGSRCIERLERIVGCDKSIIYSSLYFYNSYSEDELKELIAARSKSGDPLLWTHVIHLMRSTDNNTRDELTKITLEGDLTPTELHHYIQSRQGKKTQSSAGKPMARPKSLKGFLDQQEAVLTQLLKRKSKVWAGTEKTGDQSFFDVLRSTPTDKFEKTILDQMANLQQTYETVALESEGMAIELKKVRESIEKDQKHDKERPPFISFSDAESITDEDIEDTDETQEETSTDEDTKPFTLPARIVPLRAK